MQAKQCWCNGELCCLWATCCISDDLETVQTLKELYGDIDGVELIAGIYAEKRLRKNPFSAALTDIMSPSAIQGYFSHFLFSPHFWRPSTFGGEIGMDIVMETSLEKLFCRNIPGDCPPVYLRAPGDYAENNLPNEK